MESKEEVYTYKRSRSVAIVVRDGKILMERVFYFGREFFTLPGGGIEKGETPKQACLRELKEECGLDEINEKDRAFLWAYGLMQVPGFFDEIKNWGDEISYPGKKEKE